jgi:hypothetical protein
MVPFSLQKQSSILKLYLPQSISAKEGKEEEK